MEIIGHSILRIGIRKIDTRYSFSKFFKIEMVYGEEDCMLGNSGDLVWYTALDVSKTKEDTSSGTYGLGNRDETFNYLGIVCHSF